MLPTKRPKQTKELEKKTKHRNSNWRRKKNFFKSLIALASMIHKRIFFYKKRKERRKERNEIK